MARITKADLETKILKLNDELANYRRWLSESENKYNKLADEKEAHLEELPVYQQMQKQIKLLEEIRTTSLAGGLLTPYKGLLPALGSKDPPNGSSAATPFANKAPWALCSPVTFYWLTCKRVNIFF